jgi:hypothetical protein
MKDKLEKLLQLSLVIIFMISCIMLFGIGFGAGLQLLNAANTFSVFLGGMLILLCLVGSVFCGLLVIYHFKNQD